MKAAYITDYPKNCWKCDTSQDCNAFSSSTLEELPKNCPLRPVPESRNTVSIIGLRREAEKNGVTPQYQTGYNEGWNDCLEIITGVKGK